MLEEIFNLQTIQEQAAYTWEFGTFLASRMLGKYTINLYLVDDFFVEIWHNPEQNGVYGIKSFSSDQCFEPYLELVKIAF